MTRRRYPVCIKKNPLTLATETLIIPDLDNIRIDLTDPDIQLEIAQLGGHTRFLEVFIDDVLEKKDEHDEDIEEPNTLESYEINNYDIYFISSLEKINPKKIAGNAVLLIGDSTERTAYFVEKKRLASNNNIPVSVSITLKPQDLLALNPNDMDTKKPVKITRKNGSVLEPVIRHACTEANRPQPDPNDLWILIRVDHVSKNRSHFCENALPSITTLTLCIEWLLMIPLAAGTLKTAERAFLPPMNNDAANYSTFARSTFNSFMMLYMTLRGPGADNLGDLGSSIDSFFHSAKRTICFEKPAHSATENQNTAYNTHKIIGFLLKAGLTLSMLHYIISTAEVDFVQNQLVKDNIEDPNALLPAAVINVISALCYGFNQLNDPTIYLGFLIFGFKEIKALIAQRVLRATSEDKIEDITTSAGNIAQTDTLFDLERGNTVNNAALHTRLMEGIAPSDASQTTNYSPRAIAAPRARAVVAAPQQQNAGAPEEKSLCLIM
jgi:hypothetical protein